MTQYVLYIRGAVPHRDSDDHHRIHEEITEQRGEINALGTSGVMVRPVGNPVQGFSFRSIKETVEELPELPVVIVNAHGNTINDDHFIKAKPSPDPEGGRVYADEFYEKLAESATGSPLDVFMISCGSGSGCATAAEKLPTGSTVVNFTTEDIVYSYGLRPEAFHAPVAEGSNYAEDLFLNILCNGFADDKLYQPQITVCNGPNADSYTWDMWELARRECFSDWKRAGNGINLGNLKKELMRFTSEAQINKAFLFLSSPETHDGRESVASANSQLHMKPQALLGLAIREKLLGVICAIAYVLNRDDIGAFRKEFARNPGREPPAIAVGALNA